MSTDKDEGAPKPVHQPGARKGEEIVQDEGKEPGRRDTSKTGANRPAGKSDARDATSVDPEAAEAQDPKSTKMPPA